MANIPDIVVQAMSRSGNRHPATPESLEIESLSCMHKTKHFRVICLRPSGEKPVDPITITVQVADQVQRSALMPSSLNCSEITITPITNCRTPSSSSSPLSRQGEFEKFCTFSLASHGDYCEFELVPKYLGDGGKKAPVATIIISINGVTVLRWQPVVYHPRYGPRKSCGRSAICAPLIQQIAVSLNSSSKPSFSSSSSFQIFSPLNIEYQPFDTTLQQHQMCRALPISFPTKQSSFGLSPVIPKSETNNENLTPSFFSSSSSPLSVQTPLIKQEHVVQYNEDELLVGTSSSSSTTKPDTLTCPPSPLFPNSHHLLDYPSFNSPQRFLFDSNSNPSFLLLENSNPTFVSS